MNSKQKKKKLANKSHWARARTQPGLLNQKGGPHRRPSKKKLEEAIKKYEEEANRSDGDA